MRVEIKAGGRVITARFGILALRKYSELHDLELPEFGADLSKKGVFGIADLFYCAYLADAELADRVPEAELNQAAFTDLLGELSESQLKQISAAINEIKLCAKKLSEIADDADTGKKKAKRTTTMKAAES